MIVSGLYAEATGGFGSEDRSGEFRKAEISVYAEYGLSDWFTLIGQTELKDLTSENAMSIEEARFGFSGLGGRVRLWEGGGAVLSAEASGRLGRPESAFAEKDAVEVEADLRLLAGYGFALEDWPSFVDAQAAYRPSFGEHSTGDEIRLDLTMGTRPDPRWLLLAQSFNTLEVATSNEERWQATEHKLQLSAVYDLTKSLSLQVGGIATVAGRDALRERGAITAIWLRF